MLKDRKMSSALSGAAKIAGVIGCPVSHSKSPRLHGYWLQKYGVDGAYVPLPVAPDNLRAAVQGLMKAGFAGLNVTLPHKEAVLSLVDELDSTAARIGAVNTLIFTENDQILGRNTDAFGFIENLRDQQPNLTLDGKVTVILGAGGAARAVIAALQETHVAEIRLSNRTRQKADGLAAEFGGNITVVPWAERSDCLSDAALLVNSTNLGMTGQAPLELDLGELPGDAVVNDIVYAPLETALLATASARGLATADGLGMLLHQGRPGFEAWFGVFPEVDEDLRQAVLA
jgi:shikimate dehydrogenase